MILTVYIPDEVYAFFAENFADPRKGVEGVLEAWVLAEEEYQKETPFDEK